MYDLWNGRAWNVRTVEQNLKHLGGGYAAYLPGQSWHGCVSIPMRGCVFLYPPSLALATRSVTARCSSLGCGRAAVLLSHRHSKMTVGSFIDCCGGFSVLLGSIG
eukprot:GHUV01011616.1.p1 GENE.GHUV01011616.1~~GHUV01011616.1.p1  ORF type:complete len:105 (-),score=9.10 GHUV01011616.1:171-485(-)